MARARNIKPGFFTNEDLGEADPLERLLFIGLWCLADKEGRLEDRPKRIRHQLLGYDDVTSDDVDRMLQDLHELGFIFRYEAEGGKFIWVVNFSKHQHPNRKEADSCIPAPPEAAPKIPSWSMAAGGDEDEDEGRSNDEFDPGNDPASDENDPDFDLPEDEIDPEEDQKHENDPAEDQIDPDDPENDPDFDPASSRFDPASNQNDPEFDPHHGSSRGQTKIKTGSNEDQMECGKPPNTGISGSVPNRSSPRPVPEHTQTCSGTVPTRLKTENLKLKTENLKDIYMLNGAPLSGCGGSESGSSEYHEGQKRSGTPGKNGAMQGGELPATGTDGEKDGDSHARRQPGSDGPGQERDGPDERTPTWKTAKTAQEKRFCAFWDAYPKKVGKLKAWAVWKKQKYSEELLGRMLESLEAWKGSREWKKENGQYIPHPTTWLNRGGWEDRITYGGTGNAAAGSTPGSYTEGFHTTADY